MRTDKCRSVDDPYNLSCDLMEPFRPVIDKYVYEHRKDLFSQDNRIDLIKLMYSNAMYNGKRYELQSCIDMYVQSCLRYMNYECDKIGEVSLVDT